MKPLLAAAASVLAFGTAAVAMPGAAAAPEPAPAPQLNAYVMVKGPKGPVKAGLFSPEDAWLPIARVEQETVTLGDLTEALTAMHATTSAESKGGKKDYKPVIDRLIATRLVVLEAMEMGLDDLPEVKSSLESFELGTLRDFVKNRVEQNLKADPMEVEERYRNATREFKVRSLLFGRADDAQAFVFRLREGGDFDALSKKAIEEKKATGSADADFVPRAQALPEVLEALSPLAKGATSDVIVVPGGYAVLKVVDFRHVKDPAAKRKAEEEILARMRIAALKRQSEQLEKKHAKIDRKLLKSIDFEAKKPGFDALLKDKRVLATIAGKRTITVADLTAEVRSGFFHGMESPIREKRVNKKKEETFKVLVQKAVYDAEAAELKLADTEDYKRAVAAFRTSTLFGVFVQRALLPGIDVTEREAEKYYQAHKADYSFPAFYRLHSLAFLDAKSAQTAADKLRAGTDLKWLRANADRQVPEEKRAFELDGQVLTPDGLLPELRKALNGAKTGDVRIARSGNQHVVVFVQNITPPAPRPYQDAREEVVRALHSKKINDALDQWVAKLRKARKVEVYITQLGSN